MDDVYVDGEYIVFKLPEGCSDEDYQVALDRCSTPKAILEWVHHLKPKYWVTEPMIHRFVQLAAEHQGIDTQTWGRS
jgi:hypothetical protein